MTRMRTVSFKMPARLVDALDDLAWQRESNRSELVREAIEALTNGKRRSVTAAVSELLGCASARDDRPTRLHVRGRALRSVLPTRRHSERPSGARARRARHPESGCPRRTRGGRSPLAAEAIRARAHVARACVSHPNDRNSAAIADPHSRQPLPPVSPQSPPNRAHSHARTPLTQTPPPHPKTARDANKQGD